MDYASHDNLLIQIMIQYFTFGSFLLLLVVSGTYPNLLIRIILNIKIIKSVKGCLLNAPLCMPGSFYCSLDTDCQHRSDQNVNNPKQPEDKAKKIVNPINSASMQNWI